MSLSGLCIIWFCRTQSCGFPPASTSNCLFDVPRAAGVCLRSIVQRQLEGILHPAGFLSFRSTCVRSTKEWSDSGIWVLTRRSICRGRKEAAMAGATTKAGGRISCAAGPIFNIVFQRISALTENSPKIILKICFSRLKLYAPKRWSFGL